MFRFAVRAAKLVDVRVEFGGPFNAIILVDLAPSADMTWAEVARRGDLKIPTVFPPASVPKVLYAYHSSVTTRRRTRSRSMTTRRAACSCGRTIAHFHVPLPGVPALPLGHEVSLLADRSDDTTLRPRIVGRQLILVRDVCHFSGLLRPQPRPLPSAGLPRLMSHVPCTPPESRCQQQERLADRSIQKVPPPDSVIGTLGAASCCASAGRPPCGWPHAAS